MLLPDQIDPFSSTAVKEISPLLVVNHSTWGGFRFDNSLSSEFLRLNEAKSDTLPNLKSDVFHLNLETASLPDLSNPPSVPTSDSEDDCFQSLDEGGEEDEVIDLWVLPDIQRRERHRPWATWDSFVDKSHREPTSAYLSEAQPSAFSAILDTETQHSPQYVKPDALLHACLALCLGRDSLLFSWNEKKHSFVPLLQNITAHGYSQRLVQSCFDDFSEVGTRIRICKASFQALDRTTAHLTPAQIAFLCASRSIIHALDGELCILARSLASLLQLKVIVTKVRTVLEVLGQCQAAMDLTPTEHLSTKSLIQWANIVSINHPALSEVMQALISRACQPSLRFLSEHIGLGWGPSHHTLADPPHTSSSNHGPWSFLVGVESAVVVHEAHQSLDLLKRHSPECSLLSACILRSSPLKSLELGFTFDAINDMQARAVAYEEAMKLLIISAESSTSTSVLDTPASESFELEEPLISMARTAHPFRLEMDLFDEVMSQVGEATRDRLPAQVVSFLRGQAPEDLGLPLDYEESLSLSITPLISAQHRLLSYSVLQVVFQDHNLLRHLHLQRQFHMLGNAFFSSRLKTALFDSDQVSGEGQRKTGALTGLRLEARDSWPPAGSELRLVLMSILSDSLDAQNRPLEDCLSFAIRDMPVEDLEKCRDVDSVHALDFLRLQYTAPNEILEAIMTPQVLDKYDRIFQHLLRTMRLHTVAQDMLRNDAGHQAGMNSCGPDDKIVVEMHHFISTVADYCHNIAIETYWSKLEAVLRDVKSHIDHQRYEDSLRVVKSLDHLRELQERTLDHILQALLLKQKQTKSKQILDDIYNLILAFAAQRRKKAVDVATDEERSESTLTDGANVRKLRDGFRAKVSEFVRTLHSGKHSPGGLEDNGKDLDMSECLILRLDLSGYWTSRRGHGPQARIFHG